MNNPSSDRLTKPGDSNPSSNTRTSEHEEIASLFRAANDKLDKVDNDAKKEKQQIVEDLARDLEKFRPIDKIASEIVEELREKVSKSVVYAALDDRYKTSYRVQNARKRKKEKADGLAPTSELKPKIVVDRLGHQMVEPAAETRQPDQSAGDKGTTSKSEAHEQRDSAAASSPPSPVCKQCQAKDIRITELDKRMQKNNELVLQLMRQSNDINALSAENAELKEALSSQTFVKADEISLHELGFPIPKAKYPNLEEAMLKSRDSVYVVFDKSGRFERAIPDTLRGK
jgi:hypothetical protein